MTKKGVGNFTLDGAKSTLFTGKLTVDGGTLYLGAATAATLGAATIDVRSGTLDVNSRTDSLITIANTQTLKGGGTVNGNVTLANGGNIAAGSSVGKLTVSGNLTMTAPVGNMLWELGALKDNATGVAGVDFDQLLVNGTLDLGTSSNLTLDFGQLAANLRPDSTMPDPFWNSSHSWKIIDNSYYTPTTNFATFTNGAYGIGLFSTQIVTGGIQLDFLAHIAENKTWRGNVNGNWNIFTTQNWTGGDGYFHNNDTVTFTDSGLTKNVTLAGTLVPLSITVNNSSGNDYTFGGGGDLVGGSGITKSGEGKLTIANTGAFSLSGDIALTAGTLAFQGGYAALSGKITGVGSLRQEGPEVLTLSGDNSSFTGPITVTGGTLKAGSATALGSAAVGIAVTAGGSLDMGGFVLGDKPLTLGGSLVNSGANLGAAVNNLTITGNIAFGGSGDWKIVGKFLSTGGQFKLTKTGADQVTLDNCTFTDANHLGDIDIQGGTLWIANSTPLGDPSKTITLSNGGSIGFSWNAGLLDKNLAVAASGGGIAAAGGPTLAYAKPITLAGNLTVNVLNSNGTVYDFLTLSGNLSGAGGLTKIGGGTLTLQGSNSYGGTTTVGGGFLVLDAASGYAVPGNLDINGDGNVYVTLKRSNQLPATAAVSFVNTTAGYSHLVLLGNNQTVASISSSSGRGVIQNIRSETGITSDGTLTVDNASDCMYDGYIRNRGGGSSTGRLALVKRGAGTLTLKGTNSGQYTGGLTVEAGSLDYSQGTLPNCDYTITGGTLEMGYAAATIGKFAITGGKVNSSSASGVLTSASNYDVRAGQVNVVLAGAVGLTKTGSGTASLTAVNTFTGPTLIQEGTLSLPFNSETYAVGSIANSPLIQISAGATLNVSDPLYPTPFTVASNQTLRGSGNVQGNVTLTFYNTNSVLGAGNATSGGTLTLNQGLTVDADAKVILDLSPSATGTNNDKIAVTGALALPTSGQVKIAIHGLGATLDTTPGNKYTLMTYGSIASGTSAANVAVVNDTRYTMTPDFSVFGQIKVAVTGTAPLNLTWKGGDTTYPNNWDVKATSNWNNNSQKFYEMDNVTFDNTSAVTSVVLQDTAYQPIAVYPGSITVNSSQDYYFSGSGKISGPTGIAKSGIGMMTISTANDFTGAVSVTNGTLLLGNAAALGTNDGGAAVSSTGTLDLGGFELPLGEVISISGTGYNGQGALISSVASTANTVKNLTLADNASIGGSADWKVGGNPGGLVGGGFTLTKIGTSVVTLNGLGTTGLGGVVINEGRIELVGNTTMGSAPVTIDNINVGTGGLAELSFNASTVTHSNNFTIGGNGGTIVAKNGIASFLGSTGTLNGNLTSKVTSGDTLTLGHALTGTGSLNVNKDYVSTGTSMLTGSSNHVGGTNIYNGSLTLNCATGPALSGRCEDLWERQCQIPANGSRRTIGPPRNGRAFPVWGRAGEPCISSLVKETNVDRRRHRSQLRLFRFPSSRRQLRPPTAPIAC